MSEIRAPNPDDNDEYEAASDILVGEDDEQGDERPELDIPLRDRKLLAQPFDFIVGSLEQQIKESALVLQDDFQRRRVWDETKASRLIESLLLNVPIPVCYFSELDDGRYSVIDGQQRLTAIYRYLGNLFPLRGLRVRPELNKKRFSELDAGDQRLIKTRTIRCITIQKESHPDIRFDVFERLNTGAVRLNPQELRNSAYRGSLNELIKRLCAGEQFLQIRNARTVEKRMSDAELILRFFAFHFSHSTYRGYYATFLDDYLKAGMRMSEADLRVHEAVFNDALSKSVAIFGQHAFRRFDAKGQPERQINRAIFDAVMLAFARIDQAVLERHRENIVALLRNLSQHDREFIDAISQATRDRRRLNVRVGRWIQGLRELGIECPDILFGPDLQFAEGRPNA